MHTLTVGPDQTFSFWTTNPNRVRYTSDETILNWSTKKEKYNLHVMVMTSNNCFTTEPTQQNLLRTLIYERKFSPRPCVINYWTEPMTPFVLASQCPLLLCFRARVHRGELKGLGRQTHISNLRPDISPCSLRQRGNHWNIRSKGNQSY